MSLFTKLFKSNNKSKTVAHGYISLTNEQQLGYNAIRNKSVRGTFCQAPLNNMYFSWEGKVIACCFNQSYVLGNYPEQTIKEIWEGSKAEELRTALKHFDLTKGCDICYADIEKSRFDSVNALRFDEYAPQPYPTMMEFQISNKCNLECVMCDGFLSSAIRANREKLPAIPEKFDDNFVEQLTEFIPHLRYTTFSGGEPFLIKTYYNIWDKFSTLNNNCIIKVITNGTIFNDRVKGILEKNNFHITISLDSPVKETYEKIRIGASFDKVIENARLFNSYCKEKKTFFNFNFCPMVTNWHEIPQFIQLCNSMDASFYFSIVYHPERFSLSELSSEKLQGIIGEMEKHTFPEDTPNQKKNKASFNSFIFLLKKWEKKNAEKLVANSSTAAITMEAVFKKIDEYTMAGEIDNGEEIKLKLKAVLLPENPNLNYSLLLNAIENMTVKNFKDATRADVDNLKRVMHQKYSF